MDEGLNNIDHAWVQERLGAAIAGGLSPAEQGAFDAHINVCPACFDAFTDARDADRMLQRHLGGLAAAGDFEEELVHHLREKMMHKRFSPMVKRAGMGIAAAVALVATGVLGNYVVGQDVVKPPVSGGGVASAGEESVLPKSLRDALPQRFVQLVERSEGAGGAATQPMGDLRGVLKSEAVYADLVDTWALGELAPGSEEGHERRSYSAYNFSRDLRRGTSGDGLAKATESMRPEVQRLSSENSKDTGGGTILIKDHEKISTTYFLGTEQQNYVSNFANTVDDLPNLYYRVSEDNVKPPSFDLDDITKSGSSTAGGEGKGGLFAPTEPGVKSNVGVIRQDKVQHEKDDKIKGLMGSAQKDLGSQQYKEAMDKYREVLANDPNNDPAKLLLQYSRDRDTFKKYQEITNDRTAQTRKQGTDSEETLIPYQDLLVYPKDMSQTAQLHIADASGQPVKTDAPAPASTQPAGGGVTPVPAQAPEIAVRKIIRNGEVEFEVRSFDDASATIAAVTEEEKGYVSSTSSEKLANGKIRGSIVVRVPPERLDRVLLKLRALGELKSQQIAANDVTKQYTDVESELKALRAMEGRLINLVKNGKGEVKDLVVAEKQLGEYRVRIEKLEGDIRYYNNLVGMATLTITAFEKDIQKPTAASEQESVTLGIETEDVEARYHDSRKILEEAKGRIVESELKKLDADQYNAHIVVDVPPEKADYVAAQLKQIGKVATYNRDRKQTATGGTGSPTVQVEQKDTRFVITLYNLANVAPRETSVLTVAVRDVEGSYRKVRGMVRGMERRGDGATGRRGDDEGVSVPTGRVVTSSLNGQQPEQMTADIRADVRAEQADAVLQAIRETGEVVTSTSGENPDTANSTSTKRGIQLRLVNVAVVQARESRTMRLVAGSVPEAYGKLLGALQENAANVRIVSSQLTEADPRTITAGLTFEARRDALPAVEKAFADAGVDFLSRNVVRSSDSVNTLDSKILFQISEMVAADSLLPRKTTSLMLEVENVEKAMGTLRASMPAGVKELEFNVAFNAAKDQPVRVIGHLIVDVPAGSSMAVFSKIRELGGEEKVNEVVQNTQVPDTRFAKERYELVLTSRPAVPALVEKGNGLGATARAGLSTAVTALLYSVKLIIIGVLFVGPWVVIGWVLWRVMRRRKATA